MDVGSLGPITVVLFLLVGYAGDLGAQSVSAPVRIPDAIACPRCELTFRATATLVAPAALDGTPETVRVDSQGRYWLLAREHLPLVFDDGGKLLRTLGRRGQGPGEFRGAYDLLVAGDSLIVLDAVNRRATVLTPALAAARYVTLPFHLMDPIVISWPNAIISSGNAPTTGGAELQLHRTSLHGQQGALLKSFGPGSGELREQEEHHGGWHRLAQPKQGKFWSAAMYSYDMFHWKADGALTRTLQRRPSWFSKASAINYNALKEPPPPRIAAIEEDQEGLLWIFVRVAASTWKEAFPKLPEGTREISTRLIAFEKLFATTIEVLDPQTRRVVMRRTFDRYVVASLPNRRVAFYEVDQHGEGRVIVGTLDLSRR